MYKCVSIIPCLHSTCSFCLSEWLKNDKKVCPICRREIDYIVRNHKVRSLIETFISLHPEEIRPKEEIEEMDKNNNLFEEVI